MAADFTKEDRELEALFRKYESAPDSYVFAPLADAYRKSGMLEEAVEICKKGLRKHPSYPSGHVVQGKCHFDLGEVDEAEESFRAVIELDENNLVALKFLGMIQVGRGELERAKDRFKHILALDPDNREITSMLEDVRVAEQSITSSEEPAQTEEEFEGMTISLGDEDITSDELATTTLADIYCAQGYTDKAVKIYREVLRNQPDNDEIKRKLRELEGDDRFAEIHEAAETGFEEISDGPGKTGETATHAAVVEQGADEVETPERESARNDKPEKKLKATKATKATKTAKAAKSDQDSDAKSLDDRKSYDQFQRWLKNMQS